MEKLKEMLKKYLTQYDLASLTDAKYTNTLQGTFLTLTDSKEDARCE